MAAIDLERGLEHGRRGWGKERPDMMDNFDSEMQEWEDQLQDIQKKIEELYNEVQARRCGNGVANVNDGHGNHGNHGNGAFVPVHQSKHHPINGQSYNASHQNGVSEIGDLLQDYLGHGKNGNRKNDHARHVHFSDTIKVSQDVPVYQDEIGRRKANQRLGREQFLCSFEEMENRKNRVPHVKCCPNKENSIAKPPLGQKESTTVPATAPPRTTSQLMTAESPTTDRKASVPSILGDRKSGSPSILRKFEAMLHENEGKTLTDTGVVTSDVKCLSPGCQRRGSATGLGKTSLQKCNSEVEHGGSNSARPHYKDLRGGPQVRSQVPGSPKARPRSNSAADRDRVRKPASHHGEPIMDNMIQRGRLGSLSEFSGCRGDEGLIELLDMLEIQHEYTSRSGHTADMTDPQQVNPSLWSSKPKQSFPRPARPANQRPPSRWANRMQSPRIDVPSYRPPSPLARPPTPKTRTSSPALKHRPGVSYSHPAETVIM